MFSFILTAVVTVIVMKVLGVGPTGSNDSND